MRLTAKWSYSYSVRFIEIACFPAHEDGQQGATRGCLIDFSMKKVACDQLPSPITDYLTQ